VVNLLLLTVNTERNLKLRKKEYRKEAKGWESSVFLCILILLQNADNR